MRLSPETVVSCPTHSRCPAQPVHGCPRFDRFPDLLIELASPLATTRRGCYLKCRNAFFKKSSSMVKRHLVCKRWTIEKADENSNDTPWFALHRPNSDKLRFHLPSLP